MGSQDVNCHGGLESLRRSNHFMEEGAGVVHDDVRDAATRDRCAGLGDGFDIGHVAYDHLVIATECVGHATSSLGVTTHENDPGAECRDAFGGRPSDSRGRPGHDDSLAGE
jgi:hypothetical protein